MVFPHPTVKRQGLGTCFFQRNVSRSGICLFQVEFVKASACFVKDYFSLVWVTEIFRQMLLYCSGSQNEDVEQILSQATVDAEHNEQEANFVAVDHWNFKSFVTAA